MAQANPYPLRIDKTVMDKFKVIAAANGRSVNKEIEQLIRAAVTSYEAAHGQIQLASQDEYTE